MSLVEVLLAVCVTLGGADEGCGPSKPKPKPTISSPTEIDIATGGTALDPTKDSKPINNN